MGRYQIMYMEGNTVKESVVTAENRTAAEVPFRMAGKCVTACNELPRDVNLFVGRYPGGTVYCDRDRMENGDYKRLAFVTNAGNIFYKADVSKLSSELIRRIHTDARREREKFMEQFNRLSQVRKYEVIMDHLPAKTFLDAVGKPIDVVVEKYFPEYMKVV